MMTQTDWWDLTEFIIVALLRPSSQYDADVDVDADDDAGR